MDSVIAEKLQKHLLDHNKEDLLDILTNPDCSRNYSVIVDFITLFEEDITIGNGLLIEPEKYLCALDDAVIIAQKHIIKECEEEKCKEHYKIKAKVTVRVKGLPVFGETIFPSNNDIGFFIKISGTIIKAGVPKLLEHQKEYTCSNCHCIVTVQATYEKYYLVTSPSKCKKCHNKNFKPNGKVDAFNFIDYQEVKVQEHFGKSKIGTVPRTILVTLEGDLVDSCKPGDDVIITGVLLRRWKTLKPGMKYNIDLVLRANHLEVCNEQKSITSNKKVREHFSEFWNYYKHQELYGRNHILKSFCPEIFGLYLVKLSMVTVLAGGVQKSDENGCPTRGMSHLLLVGDAGTGKSQLLRYASKLSTHSVFTTGVGSTTAGLTVTAVRENGDWNLEAGALVLADGGLCCIDDFNSIREYDRASIHEAMEQQSISVAKAGIVTKLHTRCSVFASTNVKEKYDYSIPMSVNVAISSPLLSRFDIVLILMDSKNPDWDKSLCNFIFEDRKGIKSSQEQFLNKAESLYNCLWSANDIQIYFSVIKEINPMMTTNAGIVLRTYYQFQRMTDTRNLARTTVRLLESLIRLSQGHARLLFKERVTVLDAITAIILIESSMLNATINGGVNALHTFLPENPYDEYQSHLKSILTKLKLNHILEEELENLEKEKIILNEMSSEHINSELHKVETSPSAINASPFAEKEFNKTVSGVPIKMPFITEKKDFSSVDVKDKSPESTAKDDTNFTFRKFISGEKEYKFCVTKSITAEHSELELKKIEQIQHSDSNKNLMSNDVNGRLIEKIAKKFELSTQSQNGKVDIEKPQRLQKIFSLVEEDLDFLDF